MSRLIFFIAAGILALLYFGFIDVNMFRNIVDFVVINAQNNIESLSSGSGMSLDLSTFSGSGVEEKIVDGAGEGAKEVSEDLVKEQLKNNDFKL